MKLDIYKIMLLQKVLMVEIQLVLFFKKLVTEKTLLKIAKENAVAETAFL